MNNNREGRSRGSPAEKDGNEKTVRKETVSYTHLDREKPREQVIYGWFGRAVNVYDGRYTYFRAPENRENSPLYQYCAIPSTCWRYFDERYAQAMEMGRFLPYTHYPVYKIPALFPEDYSGNIEYVMTSMLFDLQNDYEPVSYTHLRNLSGV